MKIGDDDYSYFDFLYGVNKWVYQRNGLPIRYIC